MFWSDDVTLHLYFLRSFVFFTFEKIEINEGCN